MPESRVSMTRAPVWEEFIRHASTRMSRCPLEFRHPLQV
jgi:hypothetical protein